MALLIYMLDQFYISFLNTSKKRFGKAALNFSLFYISILEICIVLMLGSFFGAFGSQLHMPLMSSLKTWTLFSLISIFIIVKNWLRYTGKRRLILTAKSSRKHSLFILIILPILCLAMALLFYQSI